MPDAAALPAALLVAGLLLPCAANAGVSAFLESCMAEAADLSRLPAALARAGMTEIDPADGPRGPMIAQPTMAGSDMRGRRVWASRPGELGEAYTGLVAAGPGRPVEVCWHVSRPGESAARALAELERRFPPIPASEERGTEAFYGGYQRWSARVNGTDVILGVSWPVQAQPDQGSAFLYLVRPVPAQ